MKNLFLISIFIGFHVLLFSQEVNTEITKTSDSTFILITTTVYDDGREVIEKIPYDIGGFANLLVEQNINSLNEITQLEKKIVFDQRNVNQVKRFVNDSLLVSYDSLLNQKLFQAIGGEWRFIQRNGANEITTVSINLHPNNNILLRMNDLENPGGWNLRNISTQKFEIRNFQVGGVAEVVEMNLTNFNAFLGYRGVASDGTILIMRR